MQHIFVLSGSLSENCVMYSFIHFKANQKKKTWVSFFYLVFAIHLSKLSNLVFYDISSEALLIINVMKNKISVIIILTIYLTDINFM